MSGPKDDNETDWSIEAARAADAKSAHDIVILDVGPVLAVCGRFVIASATNTRQVRSVVDEVEARIAAAGGPRPLRIEGRDDLRWVLMDYGDLVVHVFLDEARQFYDLERLWADVARIPWTPDPAVASAGTELG